MWFCNNQSDDTNPMLGRWMDVSHMVGSAVCYWILSDKVKVLSWTTVQHLTDEEPRYPYVQERIRDYHSSLEGAFGSEDFGTSLDGYDSIVDYNEEGITKGEPKEESYQGPPDSPDIH